MKMKIACLTTNPDENKKLEEAAMQRGHDFRFINPRKTLQYVSEHEKGLDRFYISQNSGPDPVRIYAKDIDCIIPRIGSTVEFSASILRFVVENLGVYCPNNPWGHVFASNKAYCLQKLSANKIKVPKTIITEDPRHVAWIIDRIKLPVVVKTWNGSKGLTVGIADSKTSANSLFTFAFNAGLKILLEEYIEAAGTDYRVWVVGDKVALAMKRTSQNKNDFRANISQGAKGEKVDLSQEDQNLCIRAAHSIGLNIAGVDLMKDAKTGQSYIIEINSNPGTRIIDITGHNPFIDIIKYCEENYKKPDDPLVEGAKGELIDRMLIEGKFFNDFANVVAERNEYRKYFVKYAQDTFKQINRL